MRFQYVHSSTHTYIHASYQESDISSVYKKNQEPIKIDNELLQTMQKNVWLTEKALQRVLHTIHIYSLSEHIVQPIK